MRSNGVILWFVFSLSVVSLHAQKREQILGWSGVVSIETVPSGAEVYVNDQFLGRSPLDSVTLRAGFLVVSCYYPSRLDWNAGLVTDTLHLQPDSLLRRQYIMPSVFVLRSIPSGATVRAGDSVLGVTPLEVVHSAMMPSFLLSSGEPPETLTVETTREGFRAAIARLSRGTPMPDQVQSAITPESHVRSWPVFSALGAGIVSGVLAAHWKVQANQAADAYRLSRSPQDQDALRRFDARSGIAFAVTQVSLGILTYLLLSAN